MTILYLNNQGRLGNFAFQYAALMEYTCENDLAICFRSDLFNVISPQKNTFLIEAPKYLKQFLNEKLNNLMSTFSDFGLISQIYEEENLDQNIKKNKIFFKKGFFSKIIEVKGYFQHDQWILKHLKFNNVILKNARLKLEKISSSNCRVAVHIRLRDYGNWSVLGVRGVILNKDWYKQAIEIVNSKLKNPEFIFFSDDIEQVKMMNFQVPKLYFSDISPELEMVAMSICEHAIISPSTFSYCATLMSYQVGKIIIAPKYWAGFKSKIWHPQLIESKMIQYLETLPE